MAHNRIVIAHHLVLMGYGHWLPNEIRGSGSCEIRKELLRELGEIHLGRKREQPTSAELKAFHRKAEPLLEQEVLWFDEGMRGAIAESFAATARAFGYVVWACALLRNHAHLVVQRHGHRHDVMWRTFAEGARQSLRVFAGVSEGHRVWGQRPYSRFLFTPGDVISRVEYVEGNPEKEGLARQEYRWVVPYRR
jgi:REP element-mobilizing transposase RayT